MGEIEILILGAGPTGLGSARHLSTLGHCNWALLEASSAPGGLASSFVDSEGFVWDIGGHVQFSHYEYFDRAMRDILGPEGWLHHQRESWIWMRDRFIPYPLQNNIHRLPAGDLIRCLEGLVEICRRPRGSPQNFQDWIDQTFGRGLAEIFMEPYNRKVWACPPAMMNSGWVGDRVATTDLNRVLRNLVLQQDDVSWGPNSTFQFPKRGGTGAIWQACASQLDPGRLHFGKKVTRVDLEGRRVFTADGYEYSYCHLVSTLPLLELISLSGRTDLQPLADRGLLYSKTNVVGLGLRGRPRSDLATKCWMYFPEDDCPFYRATVFSNYSPFNVPDISRYWSLMFEVSESPYKFVDHQSLQEDVIAGALKTRLIEDRSDIVSIWHHHSNFGYPIPSLHRDEALAEIIPLFEKYDVYSRGRFGMWKYEVSNQDHSFMQGVEAVERVHNGRQEITAFDPNYVNAKKHPWPFERWN